MPPGEPGDHAKNVSFMMDGQGQWRPAPFYDLTYKLALGTHTMSLNGTTMPERNDFAEVFGIYGIDTRGIDREILLLAGTIEREWEGIVADAGIDIGLADRRKREVLESLNEFASGIGR